SLGGPYRRAEKYARHRSRVSYRSARAQGNRAAQRNDNDPLLHTSAAGLKPSSWSAAQDPKARRALSGGYQRIEVAYHGQALFRFEGAEMNRALCVLTLMCVLSAPLFGQDIDWEVVQNDN